MQLSVGKKFGDFLTKPLEHAKYFSIGGYGSGKSFTITQKIILECLTNDGLKVAVLRKSFSTHKNSTYSLFKDIISDLGLSTNKLGKNTNDIIFDNGSSIIFLGLDDREKLKSLNGISYAWVEEISEIEEDDYSELKGRLRSGKVRIFMTSNPLTKFHWIYTHFFQGKLTDEELIAKGEIVIGDTLFMHSTVYHNPFVNDEYVKELESYRESDPYRYQTGVLGKFGELGHRVFTRWKVEPCKTQIGETLFGLDLGYAVSHNRLLRVILKDKKLYITHEYDSLGLTNEQLCDDIHDWIKENNLWVNVIYADHAEPKTITTMQNRRIPATQCEKIGIINQIDRIRDYEIIIDHSCKETIKEFDTLVYKEVRGIKKQDSFNIDAHSVDSLAYALSFQVRANLKGVSLQPKAANAWTRR